MYSTGQLEAAGVVGTLHGPIVIVSLRRRYRMGFRNFSCETHALDRPVAQSVIIRRDKVVSSGAKWCQVVPSDARDQN